MKRYLKIIFFTALFLTSTSIFAQDEDEDPELPPGDPGKAPISDYIPLLVVGAAMLAYRFLPKAENKKGIIP